MYIVGRFGSVALAAVAMICLTTGVFGHGDSGTVRHGRLWDDIVERLEASNHRVERLSPQSGLDIVAVPNFLSDDEVTALAVLLDARCGSWCAPAYHSSDTGNGAADDDAVRGGTPAVEGITAQPPKFCFASARFDELRSLGLQPREGAHSHCVNEVETNRRLADPISGIMSQVSTSVTVPSGAANATDQLERRLALELGLPPPHAWDNQLLHYQAGQAYAEHRDCISDEQRRPGSTKNRAITVMVYLSDVDVSRTLLPPQRPQQPPTRRSMQAQAGGATTFPIAGVAVAPERGKLVVWNNVAPDGGCAHASLHFGARVASGTKRALQRWYDDKPIPLEPPVADTGDSVWCDPADCRHYVMDPMVVANGDLARLIATKHRLEPQVAVSRALAIVEAHPNHLIAASLLVYELVDGVDRMKNRDVAAVEQFVSAVPPAIAATLRIVEYYNALDRGTGMPSRQPIADLERFPALLGEICTKLGWHGHCNVAHEEPMRSVGVGANGVPQL